MKIPVKVKNLDSRIPELLYNSCGSRPYADTLISLHKKNHQVPQGLRHPPQPSGPRLRGAHRHLRGPCRPRWGPAAEASLRHVENARANLADIIQKEG